MDGETRTLTYKALVSKTSVSANSTTSTELKGATGLEPALTVVLST